MLTLYIYIVRFYSDVSLKWFFPIILYKITDIAHTRDTHTHFLSLSLSHTLQFPSPEVIHRLENELKLTRTDVSEQKKQFTKCMRKLDTMDKELRQMRTLIDEVRRGVTAYGIPPGGGNSPRTVTDGDARVSILCVFNEVFC